MTIGHDAVKQLLQVGEDRPIADDDARIAPLAQLAADMGSPPPDRDAPVREVMARLGDNWSALILKILSTGSFRHATLKRVIAAYASEGEISQRMLTLRLRALERDGFVARTVRENTNPPRVDYALTDLGQALEGQLSALIAWIETATPQIETARASFTDEDDR